MRDRSEKNLNWSLNVEIGMTAMWLQIRYCTFVLVVGLTGAVIFKNVDVGFHFFHHEIFSLTLELFKNTSFATNLWAILKCVYKVMDPVEHVKDRPLTGQLGDGGHCQGQVVHQV